MSIFSGVLRTPDVCSRAHSSRIAHTMARARMVAADLEVKPVHTVEGGQPRLRHGFVPAAWMSAREVTYQLHAEAALADGARHLYLLSQLVTVSPLARVGRCRECGHSWK